MTTQKPGFWLGGILVGLAVAVCLTALALVLWTDQSDLLPDQVQQEPVSPPTAPPIQVPNQADASRPSDRSPTPPVASALTQPGKTQPIKLELPPPPALPGSPQALSEADLGFARSLGESVVVSELRVVANERGHLSPQARERLLAAKQAGTELAKQLELTPQRAELLKGILIGHVVRLERRQREGLPPNMPKDELRRQVIQETLINIQENFDPSTVEVAREVVERLEFAIAP